MKRIGSILLVIVMILSTSSLVSCDAIKIFNAVKDLIKEDNTNLDFDINFGEKPHIHTEGILPAIESTCTTYGKTEGKYCLGCDKILVPQEQAPLKAHTTEILSAIEATCSNVGFTEGKWCSVCQTILVEQREISKKAHTYDNEYDADCNKCGYVRSDVECEHKETNKIEGYDSTCTYQGLTDGYECVKCGEVTVAQEIIELKEHTEVIDEGIDSTCISIGLTEGKHCLVCNTILVAQTIIDRKPHIESDWIIDTEAAIGKEGLHHIECTICHTIVKQEVIPAILPSEGLEYELSSDGKSYTVTGIGTCKDSCLVVPETYNGLPVVGIGREAFHSCYQITKVIVSDSVSFIDYMAFWNCGLLAEVIIGDSVEYIGQLAFELCDKLVSVKILDAPVAIDEAAFLCLPLLETVDLGKYAKSIARQAFSGCKSLKNINIPKSVTSIGDYAFDF